MLPRRLFTPTRSRLARLVPGSNTTPLTSVSPELARTLAPAPPQPVDEPNRRQPIPLPLSRTVTNEPLFEIAPAPSAPETPARPNDDIQLEHFFLRLFSQLDSTSRGGLNIPQLVQDIQDKAGTVLDDATLPYDSAPRPPRRIRTDGKGCSTATEQDGIVVVAHVVGGAEPKTSISSGFAIGQTKPGEGQMLLTCSHTVYSAAGHLEKIKKATGVTPPPSATLVLTSTGHVFTVDSLLSALPSSDLLLLRLSPKPAESSPSSPCPPLRSLPVNPYPSPTSTIVSTHSYLNPLTRLSRKLRKLPEQAWAEGSIVEYKDSIGRTAETGSYDDLSTFWMSAIPTHGSSGGPVVEKETGSVIGVIRGSTFKYGERASYGFATPAERIFDMFALPGFKTVAQRLAETEAAANLAPRDGATSLEPGQVEETKGGGSD
ncbi:centromere-binding protein CNN1 [Sporobolomyces koalae]|uniref:centromere-binding protein CNN1 n=1 Tax=Sporobolomyces koalae TaxID=500713 RepID=UPI00316D97E0